ncbi:MAG: ornithine carbamoyltransferase, partial [Chloroflexi bacterium]|nr:ornithine carbamoyltransferase [Chloroflexota bacterium]
TELAAHARVPVINGLSDWEHPCQALGDALTMIEHLKTLKGLRVAFFGDGNNVARSLMFACALGGAQFICASPRGFALDDASVKRARARARESGGSVALTDSPQDAAQNADVLYTDVWTSMGQENESKDRAAAMQPFQLNAALVARANSRAIVMHCLPAHRGHEITDDVMDGKNSVVFDQAENRLHAQKAILVELMGKAKRKA